MPCCPWPDELSGWLPADAVNSCSLEVVGADDVAELQQVIITTLRTAIERSSGLAASELKAEKKAGLAVHGRAGQPCPVCGDVVREVSFADSALQYCATGQTGGKPLADRRVFLAGLAEVLPGRG